MKISRKKDALVLISIRRVEFCGVTLRISEDDDVELLSSCVVVNEILQTIAAPLSVIILDTILTRSFVELVKVSMVSRRAERTNSLEISDNSIFDMMYCLFCYTKIGLNHLLLKLI